MVFHAEKQNHELYDEKSTHVLAEYKAMDDSIVL